MTNCSTPKTMLFAIIALFLFTTTLTFARTTQRYNNVNTNVSNLLTRMIQQPSSSPCHGSSGEYTESYFTQPIDHFNVMDDSQTYRQRIFISNQPYDQSEKNPLMFLYVGGEAPLDYYWASSGGYFREMGHRAKALVVFIEHRGYGESALTPLEQYKQYLTIEQALADMAEYLIALSQSLGKQFRIVTGGGSYAGMMAAYARIKYPHLIKAAIASSAPFQMMGRSYSQRDTMNYEYFRKVTSTFTLIDKQCPQIVRAGYSQLASLFNRGDLQSVQKILNLDRLPSNTDHEYIQLWIRQAFTNLAQSNHPNKVKEAPWPVDRACKAMLASPKLDSNPLNAIRIAMDIAYGEVPHDVRDEFVFCVDESGCGNDIAGKSWDIQACSQLVYYPSTNNSTDMFPPRLHSLQTHIDYCKKVHGMNVDKNHRYLALTRDFPNYDRDWAAVGTANILATTGLLDPWCSGSVQRSLSPYFIALNIPGAAHHLDLNTPTENDPAFIKPARELIYTIIMEMANDQPNEQRLRELQKQVDTQYPQDCSFDQFI